YKIPDAGLVILKVYDVLGNEVSLLINEQKQAGRYEVSFDASNLSSGVYIYKMSVNDFVSTRKMILMK
ncbi:MAG: T9SS type A sorting domain-containing protein, partial [Ignavibacteriaceae bacterium]|nr:T9SS type A sorting domain-containing protein [Ignavibacteriaceae bacterium]